MFFQLSPTLQVELVIKPSNKYQLPQSRVINKRSTAIKSWDSHTGNKFGVILIFAVLKLYSGDNLAVGNILNYTGVIFRVFYFSSYNTYSCLKKKNSPN